MSLFPDADPLAVAVNAAVTAGQLDLPQWSVFGTLAPLALPGLLWGAAIVRRVMPSSGMLRYLLACVGFAPVGVLFDIAALAAGLAAFDSEYFSSLLR